MFNALMFNISPYRHVETALLHLILDVATALLAHIPKYLAEYPFERIVAHHTARRSPGILNRLIAIITDVKRRTIEMAGVLRRIAVAPTEFRHILLRA